MQKPPSMAQIKYRAQAYLAGGLALYSPIGILIMNIYPFFANKAFDLTVFIVHLIISVPLMILGNYFLNKGESYLKEVKND